MISKKIWERKKRKKEKGELKGLFSLVIPFLSFFFSSFIVLFS